jgi:WhiB family redox-sensing transcriptional regulator
MYAVAPAALESTVEFDRPSVNGWWQESASCSDEDSSLYFAPNYYELRSVKNAREARAKLLCRSCPVLDECLAYSLDAAEEHGVWGGLNEQERRRLLRKRDQPGQERWVNPW